MTPLSIRVMTGAYNHLLRGYPPNFRNRYSREMSQVFRLLCSDRYQEEGPAGLVGLWVPIFWDWILTASILWLRYLKQERRSRMDSGLDRQAGDLTWALSTGLKAGYGLRQVLEVLSAEAPEPAASACSALLAEMGKGADMVTTLSNWKKTFSSPSLARLVDALINHDRTGGSLPDMLDPLSEEIIRDWGSDPSFYEPMRRQAAELGARVPERVSRRLDSAG